MAGGTPSPLDLRRFHRLERDFYKKLVTQLRLDPERMKWVLSLWLWFESIGHHDFIRHVSAYDDDVIIRFVDEGNACLDRLVGCSDPEGGRGDELPLTSTLVTEPMDLGFFDYHRSMAVVRVTRLYHDVASVVFDDVSMDGAARDADQPSSSRHVGASSEAPHALPVAAEAAQSTLNPMAEPWSPATNLSPEDQRSMFITFSRGYPLTRDEILDFFNTRYGKCVEVVMIERAVGGSPPMYGRVVFSSASMIAVVLNGQQRAKFVIKGKHLWARIYVPRP